MSRLATRAVVIALLSWTLLCVVTSRTPQGLHFYDPVVQLEALQQHQRGETPAWNVRHRVDPSDLSHDLVETVGWWPPAIPALVAPFTASGVSIGHAVRLVVILAGALGVVGWALWLARFPLPPVWIFALAALLPWTRHAGSAFFRFSGDNLAFAAAPWVFLALAALIERLRSGRATGPSFAAAGLVLGFSGWVKYSLAVAVGTAFVATAWIAWSSVTDRRRAWAPVLVLGLALALAPAALKLYNTQGGASDPVGHSAPDNRSPITALFVLANPVLGLADAASPYYQVLVQNPLPLLKPQNHSILAWVGLPGGLLLAALLFRAGGLGQRPPAEALALVTLSVFAVVMAGLWLVTDATRDTRLFMPVTVAALPAVLVLARAAWTTARRPVRAALLASAFIYLVIPLAYGPAYVATKVAGSRHIVPPALDLSLPSLEADDQRALLEKLAAYAAPDALWIVPNPEIALALPGRVITPSAGRSIAGDMANVYRAPASLAHWRTSSPLALRVLSDRADAPPARIATIPGATGWESHPLAINRLVLWTATLSPVSHSRHP